MINRGMVMNMSVLIILSLASAFIILLVVIAPIYESSAEANQSELQDNYLGEYSDNFKPEVNLKLITVKAEAQDEPNKITLELAVENKGTKSAKVSIEVYSLTPSGFISDELYKSSSKTSLGRESKETITLNVELSRPSTVLIGIDAQGDEEKDDNVFELEVEPSRKCSYNDHQICQETFGSGFACVKGICEFKSFERCSRNSDCGAGRFCSAEIFTDSACFDLNDAGDSCTWTKSDNYDTSCSSGECRLISGRSACLPDNYVSNTECCYVQQKGGDCIDSVLDKYEPCSSDDDGVLDEVIYKDYVAVGADPVGCMSDCVLYCQLNTPYTVSYDDCMKTKEKSEYTYLHRIIAGTDMRDELIYWIKSCELNDLAIDWENCDQGDHFYASSADTRKEDYVLVGLDVKDSKCGRSTCPSNPGAACSIGWLKTCKIKLQ
jgi:hypothetical protein